MIILSSVVFMKHI